MGKMRNGFTMIEVTFVIVIIGILSSVAIPKLAATRDDAKDQELKMILKNCAEGLLSLRTATGTGDWADIPACEVNINSRPQKLTLTAIDQNTYLFKIVLNSGQSETRTIQYSGTKISI